MSLLAPSQTSTHVLRICSCCSDRGLISTSNAVGWL
ncbi:hypothetical protein AG1IA_08774 [Rhizoctonia solani AG-1 IA]|uniref:Uncharacterized protein n=1 Tax=Thanatephorus cucumeris (strain AG1-IA) TaxID=983506 RepID=L8WLH7_THACA|nr:hypothetical protein AG1IA_08774 [Rhizoctonia solani AG-1 IA]